MYEGDRGPRLLRASREGEWDVDMRRTLHSEARAAAALYMNPALMVDEYVARWTVPDGRRIGQHEARKIRSRLWPWLLQRG